jgi:hypothetical protein
MMRHVERSFIVHGPPPIQRVLLEKSIDATVETLNMGVQVRPRTISAMVQAVPSFVNRDVDATVERHSICIDATPKRKDVGVGASISHAEVSVEAKPVTVSVSTAVDASVFQKLEVVEEGPEQKERGVHVQKPFLRPIFAIFSSLYRILIFYPLTLPARLANAIFGNLRRKKPQNGNDAISPSNDISMETVRVAH